MNVGVSSYSFSQSFRRGAMDILDAIDWVAASDATHFEITGVGLVATVATLERAAYITTLTGYTAHLTERQTEGRPPDDPEVPELVPRDRPTAKRR